ncbi:MAG: phosphate-starvation-inducible PsiE family protein [Pseudomonadales bacterium]
MTVTSIIDIIERTIIMLIVVLSVGAVGLEVLKIWERQTIVIADILLLFLYTEVISMAGAFYQSRRIPVVYPLLIAITALSRLIVLQSKEMDPVSILYEATAALILGVAAVLLAWSERASPDPTLHPTDRDKH